MRGARLGVGGVGGWGQKLIGTVVARVAGMFQEQHVDNSEEEIPYPILVHSQWRRMAVRIGHSGATALHMPLLFRLASVTHTE